MYRFSLILFLSVACTHDLPQGVTDSYQDTDTIETTVMPDTAVNKEPQLIEAEIRITYSNSFCNGYYPSDEMLEEIRKPKALEELQVILKSDRDHSFTTDHRGRIVASLYPGTYELYLSADNEQKIAPYPVSCKKYQQKSWGSVTIDEGVENYKLHIEFPCDLCDETVKRRP